MNKLIRTKNLEKKYPVKSGLLRRTVDYDMAVDDVDIELQSDEILGVVGESGSGKTTLAQLILKLTVNTHGQIYFNDTRIDDLNQSAFRKYRRDIQGIFQDPMESLDPRYTIGECVEEGMKYLTDWDQSRREETVRSLLDEVDLGVGIMNNYPHQLSGGQRQRVGLARALAVNPRIIICDEPTSALDVSIQAQIINLLLDLKEEYDLCYMFISHDLNLIRFLSDRIVVMKDGKIVERGDADRVYNSPNNRYTKKLIESSTKHRMTSSVNGH